MGTALRVASAALLVAALTVGGGCASAPPASTEAVVTLAVHWPSPTGARSIPAATDHIAITVTATGMATVSRTIDQADVVGDFAQVRFGVPAGSARQFHVEAQDVSDVALTQGDATVDLVAGETTRVVVELL